MKGLSETANCLASVLRLGYVFGSFEIKKMLFRNSHNGVKNKCKQDYTIAWPMKFCSVI